MTNPNYNLTPAHFVRARADIDRRWAQLNETHEAAKAAIADHDSAVALLHDEQADLDTAEVMAAKIAARYPDDSGEGRQGKPRNTKRGKTAHYTNKQKAQLLAAKPAELGEIARDWGRSVSALQRKQKELLEQGKPAQIASETQPIGEAAADAHEAAAVANHRRPEGVPPARQVRDVSGPNLDNGPGDQKIYRHVEAYGRNYSG